MQTQAWYYRVILFIAIFIYIILMNLIRVGLAYFLGDKSVTRYLKKPLGLIEPLGFIFLFIYQLGWVQELEFKNASFKNRKEALLIINGAPIAIGLLLGFLVYMPSIATTEFGYFFESVLQVFAVISFKNSVFNMIPIRPLFGEKIYRVLANPNAVFKLSQNEKVLQMIMVLLLMFGLIPNIITMIWLAIF